MSCALGQLMRQALQICNNPTSPTLPFPPACIYASRADFSYIFLSCPYLKCVSPLQCNAYAVPSMYADAHLGGRAGLGQQVHDDLNSTSCLEGQLVGFVALQHSMQGCYEGQSDAVGLLQITAASVLQHATSTLACCLASCVLSIGAACIVVKHSLFFDMLH